MHIPRDNLLLRAFADIKVSRSNSYRLLPLSNTSHYLILQNSYWRCQRPVTRTRDTNTSRYSRDARRWKH
ncbi:hypothetical protein CGMCC3_g17177 [Colletotrichum fructicola]|nr:uncharacterized protein CGMCC3_g17177 [Colletotrichum fructicola]KAE9566668.1 hypothetical protein CGMCC3_g17177 [Colletotrichum fructicola]